MRGGSLDRNWRLGLAYTEAVQATVKRHKIKLDLIGCHGQTLFHQAKAAAYAGRKFRSELAAGAGLHRGRAGDGEAAQDQAGSDWLPRADALSSGEGGGLCGAEV